MLNRRNLFVKPGLLYKLLLIVSASALFCTASVLADDIGVGSEDFIVESSSPDLLGDDDFEDELEDDYEWEYEPVYDPLEQLNRISFEFNDKLYFWVLKPVKQGYSYVVPKDFRMVIGNFFFNLEAPIRFVNNLLQARFEDAGVVFSRFLINSTIGVFGFGDIAAEAYDLMPRQADFGQTLGSYGLGGGVYVCWPVLGPSNFRDSVGLLADWYLHPYNYAALDTATETAAYGTEFVNRLSITADVYEEMKRISLDPYIATREAYIDYRRNFIESVKK